MKQLLIGVGVAAMAALSAGTVARATTSALPKEAITVSPSALDPGGDESLLSGSGCNMAAIGTCHFKITETSGSNQPVQWTLEWFSNGPAPPQANAAFAPSTGTLHPGKSVTVTATGLCDGWGDSSIVVAGRGPVGPGGSLGDDTTVAAIAVMQCG